MNAAMPGGVRVTVPASTANLGAGFDALGMALGLFDVVDVRPTPSATTVEVSGQGAGELPTDERHLLVRSLRAACARLGCDLGAVEVRCRNAIPHARGLGSSAAAVVAGIAAGYALAGVSLDTQEREGRALELAEAFEGHADNAAASLLGGLVLVWRDEAGFHASSAGPHSRLRPVVAVPQERSTTAVTRGLLPEQVSHSDAAFAAGRAALAVHAITARPDLVLPATEDRLHQRYREPAFPASMALIERLRGRGVAAAVSGAGPTVLVLTTDGQIPGDIDTAGFELRELAVDREGVRCERLG